MLNKVMLIGNLGADPEPRYTKDGICVCNLRIATKERFRDRNGQWQERTEWHSVVLFGKLGETASQYLRKGRQVYIEGRLQTRKWQDRDGKDRYTTEIIATDMLMLGGRAGTSEGSFATEAEAEEPFAQEPDFQESPEDDDIPF